MATRRDLGIATGHSSSSREEPFWLRIKVELRKPVLATWKKRRFLTSSRAKTLSSMTNAILLSVPGLLLHFLSQDSSLSRLGSDVAPRKPTKLCTVFGRLLGWYSTYTFLGVFAPLRNFARCKIQFSSFKTRALVLC